MINISSSSPDEMHYISGMQKVCISEDIHVTLCMPQADGQHSMPCWSILPLVV